MKHTRRFAQFSHLFFIGILFVIEKILFLLWENVQKIHEEIRMAKILEEDEEDISQVEDAA